ncbi:hypothetical protein [Flagellimonas halotolerans]|uniref:Uncharacterized protein n=1 Tax=Flagellimonas halotolerans TaxID=3112164 RepID=A0ABU6ISN0_9FLAO|nr:MULTISPECIES: hypothetical protein [unclassified Allomuricauda]MEC3966238.1 hypothetical protein [Muricauda sp. SYSU M86414]MEC4266076.1 hypothetical protein [Muricauda sp. SYSU M84420]
MKRVFFLLHLNNEFAYVDDIRELFPGMGKSYLIGKDKNSAIKFGCIPYRCFYHAH